MTDTKKPVGLRLTSQLWDSLKQYGLQHKPSAKSKEGFDVTQTIETLLSQALGISTDTSPSLSDDVLNDRLTKMIKEQISDLLLPMLNDSVSNNESDVSKLLNSKITEIVDIKISKVVTEYAVVRNETKKSLTIELVVPDADSIADAPSVPQKKTRKKVEGETFKQFAKQLEYIIPDDVNPSLASKEDADALLVFAGEQGSAYKWSSKTRKFNKN